MAGWHNADEVQNILVGLALVASMPIAGSSTAWAQNADGELALSLGMVLFSTLLSPLTTPIALHSVGLMATGDYAEDLHELAAGGTGMFLAICVLAPSLIGIGVRRAVGDARYAAAKPRLKLINSAILLVLNYSNASVSLPQAVADPDPDFLAVTLGIVVALCVLAFAAGWSISRLLKATPAQRTSLMFGLGMNNNGTGLVLASMALADHPRVMLPIIFYNLVQHLVAGIVDRLTCRTPDTGKPANGSLDRGRAACIDRRFDPLRRLGMTAGSGSISWNLSSPYDRLRIAGYSVDNAAGPTPMAGSGHRRRSNPGENHHAEANRDGNGRLPRSLGPDGRSAGRRGEDPVEKLPAASRRPSSTSSRRPRSRRPPRRSRTAPRPTRSSSRSRTARSTSRSRPTGPSWRSSERSLSTSCPRRSRRRWQPSIPGRRSRRSRRSPRVRTGRSATRSPSRPRSS